MSYSNYIGNKMKILEANNLTKVYDTNGVKVKVINGISLTTNEGEFLSITGPSGSGKSTLLYLLSGLDKPTSGEVKLLGKDINKMSSRELAEMRRHQVSFVYQFYNLIPNLSVYENIILPKRIDSRLSNDDNEYLKELLNLAGIEHIKDRRPDEISGGEQQRAAILRAVFTRPNVIFLDEPTGNLDSKSSDIVINLIKKINKEYGTSVIMVTHSLEQAKVGDRIINIIDGRINNDIQVIN